MVQTTNVDWQVLAMFDLGLLSGFCVLEMNGKKEQKFFSYEYSFYKSYTYARPRDYRPCNKTVHDFGPSSLLTMPLWH
jgi:hypothetical protein